MTDTTHPPRELSTNVQASLHHFLDQFEPLRSELYRYCRHLTRSPWDAEDLAQDTLARAFVTLGRMQDPPPNPRAWLFRVASNLWIDQLRRVRTVAARDEDAATGSDPRAAREAAGTLISQLAPQERAAVVLKDVFELSLEEIAEALSTTTGAVKAALHRGRGKLTALAPDEKPAPSSRVLDAFSAAFNAQNLDGLVALLLDSASVEIVGASEAFGPGEARTRMFRGMLFGSQVMANAAQSGEAIAALVQGVLPVPPRGELRMHRGEPLLLLWYQHTDGEAVRAINRFETSDDGITRLRNYFYTPDFIQEVCGELNVPCRTNGNRYWLYHCGRSR
jgi:RNA polymerase sigma-70 factor, ECF subfamily